MPTGRTTLGRNPASSPTGLVRSFVTVLAGAALLTGATLYLIGRAKGTLGHQVLALVPTWSPVEVGLILSGGF